jgi:hypothetical protein
MIKGDDKRGSHVGVVISFVIFVTFLIFMYAMTKGAFREEEKRDSLMDSLKTRIIENVSSDLTIITVNLETSSSSDCIELNNLVADFGLNSKIIVKNQDQETTEAAISGNDLRINRLDKGDNFFKIYQSQRFDTTGTGSWSCDELSEGTDYTLGFSQTQKYVFEKSIFELIKEYNRYPDLKIYLNVPDSSEFSLGFIYDNGTEFDVGIRDISKDIYIKEIPIEYVSLDGDFKTGFIRIGVW